MKLFAMLSIVVALYLLYRIAFPKKIPKEKSNEIQPKKESRNDGIVGRSRVVLSSRSQPPTTPATPLKSDVSPEKTGNFADENPPMDVEVPMEYEEQISETEADEIDEETEEIRETLGQEAGIANGFTFEEIDMVVETINQLDSEHEAQAAEILYREEKTEYVEQLSAISPEKATQIKGLIDLHVSTVVNPTNEDSDETDTSNLNIADFLS